MENIIIVGAGPAGISAALYAARGNMDPLIINTGIGSLEKAEKISDYERDMESSKEQYERPFEYEEELNQKLARQYELNNMLDLENGKSVDEDLGGLKESEMSKDIGKNDIGKESINKNADRGEEYGTIKM